MYYSLKYETFLTVIDKDNAHYNLSFDTGAKFVRRATVGKFLILTDGKVEIYISQTRANEIFEIVEKDLDLYDGKWRLK